MNNTKDPIFAAFAQSAPRLDLAFYLTAIGRHYDPAKLGPTSPAAIRDMVGLYMEITGSKPGSTAAQKRKVWQAIDRLRSSYPALRNVHVDEMPIGEWWPTAIEPNDMLALALDVAGRAARHATIAAGYAATVSPDLIDSIRTDLAPMFVDDVAQSIAEATV